MHFTAFSYAEKSRAYVAEACSEVQKKSNFYTTLYISNKHRLSSNLLRVQLLHLTLFFFLAGNRGIVVLRHNIRELYGAPEAQESNEEHDDPYELPVEDFVFD